MVEYVMWNKAVHDVYKSRGGDYGSQDVVQAITRAAARFYRENRDQILRLGMEAARTLAEELIDEYIRSNGQFP